MASQDPLPRRERLVGDSLEIAYRNRVAVCVREVTLLWRRGVKGGRREEEGGGGRVNQN